MQYHSSPPVARGAKKPRTSRLPPGPRAGSAGRGRASESAQQPREYREMLSWALDGAQGQRARRKARPGEDSLAVVGAAGDGGDGTFAQAMAPSSAWMAQPGPMLPLQPQPQLTAQFACPICLRASQLPVRQDCGHALCLHCIQQAFATVGGCPLCQARQIFSTQGREPTPGLQAALSSGMTAMDAQQNVMIGYGSVFQDPFVNAVSMGMDTGAVIGVGATPEPTDLHLEALSDFSDMIDLADLVASDSESQRPPLRQIPRHMNGPSWSSTTPTRSSRSSQRKVVGARPRSTSAGPATSRKVVVRSNSANANIGGKRKRRSTEEPAVLMRWEEVEISGTRPEQRYDCGCTVYGSHMFVVGGIVGKLRSNDLHYIDLADTASPPRWTRPTIHGTPPPTGSLLQVFVVNHTLYIIGGTSDGKFLSEVYAVNLASKEWRWEKIGVSGRPPSTRYWYSVAVIGKIAVLYGGYGHPHRLSDTFALRLDLSMPTWVELNPRGEIPGPASTHSVCVHNDKMFIFGGYDGKLRRGSLHSFEIDHITQDNIECVWQKVETCGKPPAPRYTHSAAVIGSKMIIYGGNTGCLKGDATILELDGAVPVWRAAKCDPSPTPREWHRVAVFNGAMYVFGGHVATGNDNGLYRLTFQ